MPAGMDTHTGRDVRTGAPEPSERSRATSAVDFERLADLVANGEVAWPTDLPEQQATDLTRMVRDRLRSRLVRITSRLVAAELTQDLPPGDPL